MKDLDEAFGPELPFSSGDLSESQLEALGSVFGDHGYQAYLQDQVNRQIIRDFVVNAVMLGFLTESAVSGLSRQVATREGRAALSLHMLMTSVEQAAELVGPATSDKLKALKTGLEKASVHQINSKLTKK